MPEHDQRDERLMSRRERSLFGTVMATVGAIFAFLYLALGLPWYILLAGYLLAIAWDGWKLDQEWSGRPVNVRRFVDWWTVYEDIRQPDGGRNVYFNVWPIVVGALAVAAVLGVLL